MALFDQTTRLQVMLQRVKAGLVRAAALQAGEELTELLAGVLANAEVAGMTPTRLVEFLDSLDRRAGSILDRVWIALLPQLREIAQEMAEAEAGFLEVPSPDMRSLPGDALGAPVLADGVAAATLAGIFAVLVQTEVRRIRTRVRVLAGRGESNSSIVQALIGPRSRNNRGAVIGIVRRKVAAFTDLATQQAAEQARQLVWLQNAKVKKYRWTSILDSGTCLQCGPLDGNEYEVGKGPLSPIHYRCRCFTVAITDEPVDRSRGVRPAQGGEVQADLTYIEWLKKQDPDFQSVAIGKTRAQLLRSGGLTASEFSRLQLDRSFQPMTLEQMKRRRPLAFSRAGIE